MICGCTLSALAVPEKMRGIPLPNHQREIELMFNSSDYCVALRSALRPILRYKVAIETPSMLAVFSREPLLNLRVSCDSVHLVGHLAIPSPAGSAEISY
jgi:hypothetical protein